MVGVYGASVCDQGGRSAPVTEKSWRRNGPRPAVDRYALGLNVENLTFTGSATLNGTGNVLANIIRGTTGANVLDGGAGNDQLYAGAGDDTIVGGIGNDILKERREPMR